jgi:GntR family transcriptional regulator, transcriptional repressor for pyruvate dehydrogenase complex
MIETTAYGTLAIEKPSATGQGTFRPIIDSRAFEEVVDQLSHAVHTGLYEVGARLPTIDELAKAMQVSRPTVGEAVRVLARAGVLRVKRGASGGIVVISSVIPPAILKLSSRRMATNMRELVEARRPIELELVRLAVLRATDTDFAEMRAALKLQEDFIDDFPAYTFGNFKFHYAIGRAARSNLLFHFQSELTKELAMLIEGWTPRDRENPSVTISEHHAILAALEARDWQTAAAAVDRHLLELEELAEPLE